MSLERELNLEVPFRDRYHEAVLSIVRTGSVLTNVGEQLFREFDLTEAQFNVLFSLKYNPHNVTQSDLGKRLVVTRASITSVLDRLEGKGLVARVDVPNNRRIYHVELTEKGKALIDEVEPLYREKIREAMQGLSERDCRDLIAVLERVRSHAGAQAELAVP
ncbi:MAG: MarR family transcriptional regulator [Candidatus Hydrogenedentes bacterium]|nr:MarR family transcriptional regulator [Candidatus Hydrogenedentota bacterium]